MTRKELESVLAIIAGFILWYSVSENKAFLVAAFVLSLIGLFSPSLTSKISRVWLQSAEKIGGVVSKILLSIIFVVFVVPAKLFSKNKLALKRIDRNSYYFTRDHQYEPADLKDIW